MHVYHMNHGYFSVFCIYTTLVLKFILILGVPTQNVHDTEKIVSYFVSHTHRTHAHPHTHTRTHAHTHTQIPSFVIKLDILGKAIWYTIGTRKF